MAQKISSTINTKYKEALDQNMKEETSETESKSKNRKILTEIRKLVMKKQTINCTITKENDDIQKEIQSYKTIWVLGIFF